MTDGLERSAEDRDARRRVLEAAAALVARGGVAALTTRAVASAASVQVPTLYRLFGDKLGLLDAVAEHGLAAFVASKASAEPHKDPVHDLRDGWDGYVAFGLANPAVFAIMNEVRPPGSSSPAARAGLDILRGRIRRIALAGRLAIPIDRAVELVHAVGVGVVATLLATRPEGRDPHLAASAREAVMGTILTEHARNGGDTGIAPLAIALGARLGEAEALTPGERLLLEELLSRLSSGGTTPSGMARAERPWP